MAIRLSVAATAVVASGCICTSIESRPEQALADAPNLVAEVRIDQDDINAGSVPFDRLFYAGKHIFSNRFTTEDNYGEGVNGPRRSKIELKDRKGYPFLRFNGLDSQSCLECHLAVGFAPQTNYDQNIPNVRFAKQLGFTGGGAGFASSAFGFENLKCAEADAGCDPTMGFVRSPPHAFGSGYVQTLAEEMSWELQALREQAIATPGVPVPLVSKGVDFGMIQADANGTLNLTEVVGVSADLVVRPFQWRGIASNLRNFIRDAMNFHFSVQAKEFLDVGDRRTTMEDKDQVEDEMTEGDITAVATFLTFLRPPTESTAGLDAAQVALGREAFFKVKCDSCHRPTLHLDKPVATIRDPRKDTKLLSEVTEMLHISPRSLEKARESHGVSLTVPLSSGISPTLEKLAAMKRARMSKGLSKDVGTLEMVPSLVEAVGGYARDLSRPDGPPETLPRLPEHDGGIDVPLYSDLKRHDMGSGLEESFAQKDDCGHEINGKLFLTRPLWGVADTGPWMHDGRALTLTEAIRAHGGEASDELEAYEKLDERERVALRAFLSSLRLPTVPTKVGS